MASLVAYDLLRELSQYNIGNTDKIFTSKTLKSRFRALDFKEIDNFLTSCDSQISEIQANPCLNSDQKRENCQLVFSFYKLAKPIATKKLKESFNF
tara:strand:+ start:1089 stop:1376 length:288 start_codon:yes stop_codon:yes gene_type:complete